MTGGRLKRVAEYVKNEKEFCFTYGDGLSDINIENLISFHRNHGKLATVSAVLPPGRFGALEIEKDNVSAFTEKPKGDGSMINGGYFVISPKVIDYIDGDQTRWEKEPAENLAKDNNMSAYIHKGNWRPMDTLRDKEYLENLWEKNEAFWKVW